MAVNKVIYGGNTVMDISDSTISAESIAEGNVGYDKSGNKVTGTAQLGASVDSITLSPTEGNSITFTGLKAAPKMFSVNMQQELSMGSTRIITSVMSDGSNTYGTYCRRNGIGSSTEFASSNYFTWTYSNGTLKITSQSSTNGGVWKGGYTYRLIYAY